MFAMVVSFTTRRPLCDGSPKPSSLAAPSPPKACSLPLEQQRQLKNLNDRLILLATKQLVAAKIVLDMWDWTLRHWDV